MVFKKLFSKKQPTSWLTNYPVYEQPHTAPFCKMTAAQAKENFAYLMANKESRVDALANLLNGFNTDLKSLMAEDSADSLVKALYTWSGEHWPQYFDSSLHNNNHWIESARTDDNLIYSVITDTAIALGEAIIQRRPTYSWGIDNDKSNRTMMSYQRLVLLATRVADPTRQVEIDIEFNVVGRFLRADTVHQRRDEVWLELVNDCISGGYEGIH